MIILHFVETLMDTGKEGTNDGTGETCTFAQVHGICCLQNTIFVSAVAAEIVKIVSPLTGTVSFLQTLGKLYDSFAIGAQTVDLVSLSLQDAVNNVSSVNEYIKSTVATVKEHFNMNERSNTEQQMVPKELFQRKHRSRWNSSNKVWHDCKTT